MNTQHPTLTVRWDVVEALRSTKELEDDNALAAAMGVDRSSVSRVFSGKAQPGPRFQAGLCIALGAKLDHLFAVTSPVKERAA